MSCRLWLFFVAAAVVDNEGGWATSYFSTQAEYIFREEVENNWIEYISDAAVASLWEAILGIHLSLC